MNDGITPSFTDDQISPLHNDDGGEESSVASIFQDLAVIVGLQTIKNQINNAIHFINHKYL